MERVRSVEAGPQACEVRLGRARQLSEPVDSLECFIGGTARSPVKRVEATASVAGDRAQIVSTVYTSVDCMLIPPRDGRIQRLVAEKSNQKNDGDGYAKK